MYICMYIYVYIYMYIYNTGESVAVVKVSIIPNVSLDIPRYNIIYYVQHMYIII